MTWKQNMHDRRAADSPKKKIVGVQCVVNFLNKKLVTHLLLSTTFSKILRQPDAALPGTGINLIEKIIYY